MKNKKIFPVPVERRGKMGTEICYFALGKWDLVTGTGILVTGTGNQKHKTGSGKHFDL